MKKSLFVDTIETDIQLCLDCYISLLNNVFAKEWMENIDDLTNFKISTIKIMASAMLIQKLLLFTQIHESHIFNRVSTPG